MPAISMGLKIIISVIAGIMGVAFGILSVNLAADFKYLIKKSGTKPAKKSWIIWVLYIISGLVMIIGPALVAVAPSKVPPHFFVVVDSSTRMNAVFPAGASQFPAGTSKWNALQGSIQKLMKYSPDSDKYRLIVLGGNQPESTHSCNDNENKIVLDNRENIVDTIRVLKPGGVALLDDALEKIRKILSDIPDEQTTVLYLFLGGGDGCAKDEWNELNYFLAGAASLLDKISIEIILFPNENNAILGASEIYKTIDKYDLTNVNVHSPENAAELADLVNALGNNSVQAINTATSLPIPPSPIQPVYTLLPTDTPLPTYTLQPTYTPLPTYTLQPLQPTYTLQPLQPTYTPQPLQPTYTPLPPQPTYPLPPPPNCAVWAWDFNTDGDSNGWQLGQGITVEIQKGYMLGNITQPQGFWSGPDNLNIDAATYKSLEMRYRIVSAETSDVAYLYWIKAGDSQFGNDKRIKFEVQTNNTWQDISVDLAQSINWTGVVTGVRLYPAWFSNLGASVEYDYIWLCK